MVGADGLAMDPLLGDQDGWNLSTTDLSTAVECVLSYNLSTVLLGGM